jgi:hypothetical protein
MADDPETSPTGLALFFNKHPRLLAVMFFAFAMIFAIWAFYLPIHGALQGVPKIILYPKTIYLCIIFTIFGVLYLILGPKTYPLVLKFAALRGWKKWLISATVMIPLILIAEQVQQVLARYLEGLGYKF